MSQSSTLTPVHRGDAEGLGQPLSWASSREMNAIETLMWRFEFDPHLRSPVCLIEVLDRLPDWKRFRSAIDWGSRMAPRLRQKVVEPAMGIGTPIWVNDPEFDIDYHVRRTALPTGGGWPDVLRAAENIAMTPLDRARAPWESLLMEGLPDGRAAHIVKIHHSVTDGLGAFQLLKRLHSRSRDITIEKPQPPPPAPERPTPVQLLLQQLKRDASFFPAALRRTVDIGSGLRRPVRSARQTARLLASMQRMASRPDASPSPLLENRSMSWRFHLLEAKFKHLRAAAKAVNATVNDAFFAALLGAFRRYHEELGCPIDKIPMGMPISTRRAGDEEGGNRFVGARFAAPVGIKDAALRMKAINQAVQDIRHEPALDAIGTLAPVLARLPGPLLSAAASQLTKGNDLQASGVPGMREAVYLAGARVERTFVFAPLPGCAAMISLVTHGDTCCVGANVDSAAVTDQRLFSECLARGFAEVMAVGGECPPPAVFT